MDRNDAVGANNHKRRLVALRKESVDRNWAYNIVSASIRVVALRKESVDRNLCYHYSFKLFKVALRKESVDRNIKNLPEASLPSSRSPQGERG